MAHQLDITWCMYGTGIFRCTNQALPDCKPGYRFCGRHMSLAAKVLPTSEMPDGFTPDPEVKQYMFPRSHRMRMLALAMEAHPEYMNKDFEQMFRANWKTVRKVRLELEYMGKIPVFRWSGGRQILLKESA